MDEDVKVGIKNTKSATTAPFRNPRKYIIVEIIIIFNTY